MKLGTIVGIVFSCILIVCGIVFCCIGVSVAEENGQSLFTQKNENGTYHSLIIDENITRIDLSLENVDVIVSGNADVSEIEFYNFNPNNYALSVTTNVISFEETPKIESVSDILTNGFNFKGLRYVLDFKGYKFKSNDKRVVINLAAGEDIKILDISAKKGSVDISKLVTESDITVNLGYGDVELTDITTTSVIEISGTSIDTDVNNVTALSLKYNAEKSALTAHHADFAASLISVSDGNVDYQISDSFEKTDIIASSDTGSLTVNSISSGSPLKLDADGNDKTLEIKTKSANISITHPTSESSDTESSDSTN